MGWALFGEWEQLQFVNYSISEEFEDGTIGAWCLEDWEIYGPGAGGYSSSGPYGDWEADIVHWLNNGSALARDIIDWDLSQLASHNMSGSTREAAASSKAVVYLNGNVSLPQNGAPTFGPEGSGAEYSIGDIVVTGARSNSDQSISYRFASYDPYSQQQVSWVENASFLDMARNNGDANAILFNLAPGEAELTLAEQENVVTIRQAVQDTIWSLRLLDPNSYFEVTGHGRIRVSELITLFTLADYEIRPAAMFTNPEGTIGNVVRNNGNPVVGINRTWISNLAYAGSLRDLFLIHEMVHATRLGSNLGMHNREAITNDIAAAIVVQLQRPLLESYRPGGTTVIYRPNVPSS